MFYDIIKLIENKKYNNALLEIEKINNNKWEKYNLKGLIYFYLNEFEKSKEEFEKGLKIDPINPDLLYNYSHVLISLEKELEAWKYLMRIKEKDWSIYDILGDIEFKNRSKTSAIKFYNKAYELNKKNEMAKKLLEQRKKIKKNIKVSFFCSPGLETFVKPIAREMAYEYNVNLIISNNPEEIKKEIKRSDIIWLEWGNEVANFVTNNVDLKDKKVICRIHGYEVFTDIPKQIKWDVIDHVFFVAEHKKDLFFKRFGNIINPKKISILRNGIDLNKFPYFPKKTPGKNLVIIGNINYRKGFEILLMAFKELIKKDDSYKLYVRGNFQDLRYKMAIETMIKEMSLEKHITFVPRIEDLGEWLKNMDFILSTSIEESFHSTVGEAMAIGLKPIIHAWKESRKIWPEENIFNDIDGFLNLILNADYNSEQYRKFIEDNYTFEKQISQIEKTFEKLEKDIKKDTYTFEEKKILRFTFSNSSEKKYIWYVMNEFEKFQYGGGERVIASFSREAKKYGYKIILISNNYSKKSLDIMKDINFKGEILIINTPLSEYPEDIEKIMDFEKELKNIKNIFPPELVIGHPVTTSLWLEKTKNKLNLNIKHYLTTIVNFFIGNPNKNIKFYKENTNNILFIDALTKEYLELKLGIKNYKPDSHYHYVGVPYFSINKLKNISLNNNFDDKIRIITYPRLVYTKSFLLNAVEDMAKLINNGYEFYVNIVGKGGFSNIMREIIKFHRVEKFIKIIPMEKIDFRFVSIHDLAINTGVSAIETSYLGIPTIHADTTLWFNFINGYTGYVNPRGILGKDFKLKDPTFDFYKYNTYFDIIKNILDKENPKRYLRNVSKDVRKNTIKDLDFYDEKQVFKNILKKSNLLKGELL
ncbi:hypothetical protein OSSY52_07540 [Tepiditoga spiralis]|uniref:Glycosyl transferase family 1 domain-containing protein n=1 Tax=Tepiditoga spiralis TaxID=2108365 RepID=A0A7G1G6X2_9BACT|nr:glycosyltransferase [Tepiditoga spiralis]BBE30613.1 hypothetical protein OSSY52_07540 [Tepiditoga spiralis]